MARPTQKQIDAHNKRVEKRHKKGIALAAFDLCAELRRLAARQPKRGTVLLPMCKASDWRKGGCDDVDFEPVKISELLSFLADMIE